MLVIVGLAMALAVLLLAACSEGDDSGSEPKVQPPASEFSGQAGRNYEDAKATCGAFPPKKAASELGLDADVGLRRIAEEYAAGYRPKFREPTLEGCLDGLASAPAAESKPTPISCLEEAGLSEVEKRDRSVWRGFTPEGTIVLIDKLPSKAEARQAVKQADLAVGEAVGAYFVREPFQDAESGSTAAVADCLRGK